MHASAASVRPAAKARSGVRALNGELWRKLDVVQIMSLLLQGFGAELRPSYDMCIHVQSA